MPRLRITLLEVVRKFTLQAAGRSADSFVRQTIPHRFVLHQQRTACLAQ